MLGQPLCRERAIAGSSRFFLWNAKEWRSCRVCFIDLFSPVPPGGFMCHCNRTPAWKCIISVWRPGVCDPNVAGWYGGIHWRSARQDRPLASWRMCSSVTFRGKIPLRMVFSECCAHLHRDLPLTAPVTKNRDSPLLCLPHVP